MPRYMDRHNIPAATSADLEQAHRRDLDSQEQYGVTFLTYWFDPADGTGICLAEAPDENAVEAVHRAAHGDIPSDIIEVDLADVRAFMGRVSDPEPVTLDSGEVVPGTVDSPLRSIVFTDLQDSTTLMQHLGHARGIEALEAHDRLVAATVLAHGGSVVKNTGDGFLLSFASPVDSLACAVELQRAFARHRREHPDLPLHIRIGVNAGLPIERGGDLFGTAVQLAARICAHAQPDQIAVAGVMRDLCGGAGVPLELEDLGRVAMKGFVSAVQLYALRWAGEETVPAG